MGVLDYLKPVSTWSPEKVRKFLAEHADDEYILIDVRQPEEYRERHLPGARLIPVGQLPERLEELERDKPTIVY